MPQPSYVELSGINITSGNAALPPSLMRITNQIQRHNYSGELIHVLLYLSGTTHTILICHHTCTDHAYLSPHMY